MAKQTKKEKQEKQEFDLILEQLKKSYGEEFDKQINESQSYEDDDEELSALLSKIFAEDSTSASVSPTNTKTDSMSAESTNDEKGSDSLIQAENETESADTEESSIAPVSEESVPEEPVAEESVAEESIAEESVAQSTPNFGTSVSGNAESEQEVDDILGIMFANKNKDSTKKNPLSKLANNDPDPDEKKDLAEELDKSIDEDLRGEIFEESVDEEIDVEFDENIDVEFDEEIDIKFDSFDEIVEEIDDETDDETDDEIDEEIDDEIVDEIDDEIVEEIDEEIDDEIDEIDDEIVDEIDDEIDDEIVDEIDDEIDDDLTVEDITEELITAVEDEEYETDNVTEQTNDESDSDHVTINADEIAEHLVPILEDHDSPAETAPRLVLSIEEYTADPLQETLPISITASSRTSDTIKNVILDQKQPQQDSKEAIDINDISLLLKFGYDDAVKAQLGEDNTQEALLAQSNHYVPEKHKTPFGFCGKEFSDRKQIPEIKAKFKSEKRTIIAKLIAVSVIAFLVLSSTVFFEFFSKDRGSYPMILSIEILFLGFIGIILGRKLISGIIGIVRFEAGLYSILSLILMTSVAYNIVTLICYAANAVNQSINNNPGNFMLFAFTACIYSILALIADLINCTKESDTFDLISSSESLYTTEKQFGKMVGSMQRKDSAGLKKADYLHSNEKAYKIRQADLISGYFKKTAMNQSGNVNLVYLLGIVPIISLVIGCCCALFGGNIMCGISSVMLTFLLCIPYSFLFTHSVSEYVFASHLKDLGIAFIGNESVTEYAATDTVILNDRDVVEIISYTEIQPGKNANVKKYVSIAYGVFSVLGGTLSEISESELSDDLKNKFNSEKHGLVINEIKDNGINLYFDSSMNVLLGDKSYMREHGINVKTDTNLTTATKGADRSVIYMAFDGSPQLGFILHSQIKKDFWHTVELLNNENIRVFIDSYEPQINDQFFESNKDQASSDIKVHKPIEYENPLSRRICDGRIISTKDALSIAGAIPFSRKIIEQRKRTGRIHFTLVGCGILVACLLTLLLNVPNSMLILGFLKKHITFIFNLCMLGGAIPAIVTLNKLYKNNRRKK